METYVSWLLLIKMQLITFNKALTNLIQLTLVEFNLIFPKYDQLNRYTFILKPPLKVPQTTLFTIGFTAK